MTAFHMGTLEVELTEIFMKITIFLTQSLRETGQDLAHKQTVDPSQCPPRGLLRQSRAAPVEERMWLRSLLQRPSSGKETFIKRKTCKLHIQNIN